MRRRLDEAVLVFEGIFRPSGDNDAELRRHHIQPLRHILADQHLLFASMLGQIFRLDYHFDPLKMGCEALAGPRRPFAIRTLAALADLRPDRGNAGLDLLEDKGLLLVVGGWGAELLRPAAEAGAIEGLEDLRQPLDALIGIGVSCLEISDLLLQGIGPRRLFSHGKHHGFQRFYVIREFEIGRRHRPTRAHFAPVFLPFQAADSLRRRAFSQQSPAASPARHEPASSPCDR